MPPNISGSKLLLLHTYASRVDRCPAFRVRKPPRSLVVAIRHVPGPTRYSSIAWKSCRKHPGTDWIPCQVSRGHHRHRRGFDSPLPCLGAASNTPLLAGECLTLTPKDLAHNSTLSVSFVLN